MPKTPLDELVEHYVRLPYTVSAVFDTDDDGNAGYVSRIEELPGCLAQGRTAAEAVERVYGALRSWLVVALEDGMEIPEPRDAYSGNFVVRIPKGLHGELVRRARGEGVSLNQLVSTTLAGAVGWGRAEAAPPREVA